MITILPVHWQLTVLKVVGCVIVGGEWCDKTSIPIRCSLAGHFRDLASGNFMNFYRILAHREYDSSTLLLIIMERYYIAACSLQLLSHTVTVPGTIFAAYSQGLTAYIYIYIIYNKVHAYNKNIRNNKIFNIKNY